MLLPDKYVREGSSLLGQAARLVELRRSDMTVSDLWSKLRDTESAVSYDSFVLSLDLLYLLGVLELQDGLLHWRSQ
jgi:hypothetical protein